MHLCCRRLLSDTTIEDCTALHQSLKLWAECTWTQTTSSSSIPADLTSLSYIPFDISAEIFALLFKSLCFDTYRGRPCCASALLFFSVSKMKIQTFLHDPKYFLIEKKNWCKGFFESYWTGTGQRCEIYKKKLWNKKHYCKVSLFVIS